ncbi:hypothetical protein PoB_007010600 [Plakobranchus ocellatus]|uniref:Troponin T n=1 Tax=Plakobranchus ocellatus TaxID=259542 RepID=A0AAV4DHI3_9GAST|nr:hypothetical protein PoB_007010600 [Plakobranchus ocellatus]
MATMEEIVKKADLLGYRGEKREEYLKQEFKLLAERQERKEKEEAERQEKKEEAERQEKKEEAESQEKKEEAERQERKEEADCKERLELEKMKLDAEMKLLQAKIEAGIIKNEPDGSGARKRGILRFKEYKDSEDYKAKLPQNARPYTWFPDAWSKRQTHFTFITNTTTTISNTIAITFPIHTATIAVATTITTSIANAIDIVITNTITICNPVATTDTTDVATTTTLID